MHKFFDYLEPDLPVSVIRDLLGYIRRFAALFSGGVPVEGAMDGVGFCATEQDSGAVPRPLGAGGPPAHPAGRHRVKIQEVPHLAMRDFFIGSGPARQRSSPETPAAPCPAP